MTGWCSESPAFGKLQNVTSNFMSRQILYYILLLTILTASCNHQEISYALSEPEKAELSSNIKRINTETYNTMDSIRSILDSVEFKIKNEGLTKAIYTLKMHHEKYLDKINSIRAIVIQASENICYNRTDTLNILDAENFSDTYSTSKFYQAGIGNAVNQSNYWINRVFHDKSFFAVFSDSTCPQAPKLNMQYLKEPTPEIRMSLGEFYLLVQKSILRSNEISLEAYDNIIKTYYKSETKGFFPQETSLHELKYGSGWYTIYKDWKPNLIEKSDYMQ